MPIGSKRLILVMRPSVGVDKFASLLRLSGYNVIKVCTSGAAALRSASTEKFDIVLAGNNLPDMTGLHMAIDMLGMVSCSVVLITTPNVKSEIEAGYSDQDITCLAKPVQRNMLINTLESILSYRDRVARNRSRKEREASQAERNAILGKAKAVLMEKQNMDESSAFRTMQKTSMDTGIPLSEIARVIIATDGEKFYDHKT